ncbi:hypothetical protein Scep_014850 [Stephania cephalantha]|uniref:Uncharacterized protein n=1 Tax=Stephania cephalantha TaxID=152367 RepID=A0AAP0J219_9MAGN
MENRMTRHPLISCGLTKSPRRLRSGGTQFVGLGPSQSSAKSFGSTNMYFDVEGDDVDNFLVLKTDSNYPMCPI